MTDFEVKGVKFQITGTRYLEYICDNKEFKTWFADVKNLTTNETKQNINYKKLKKYL